jgi:hypothetical protein
MHVSTHPLQVMGETLDPPFIASSLWGMVLVRVIIVRAIIIIVPFIASFVLDAVSFLALVFDLATCIPIVDNVTQISVVPILATLLQRSDVVS